MGGIIEFGPSGRQRPIVPAEERLKAEEDAIDWGIGYLYDERRLDPGKIEMVLPDDSPLELGRILQEYFEQRSRS